MKYIHKTRLGLEHCFTELSPLLAMLGEYSPEDIMEQLMGRSVRERNEICKKIFHLLQQLLSSDLQHKDLIPDNVRRIAESLIPPDAYSVERLLPVFMWIEKMHIKNEQDRVKWLTGLHGLAALTDTITSAFIENFPLLDSQNVVISRDEDCILISLPEKAWGCVSLHLPQAESDIELEDPIFGCLFVMEADASDEKCELRLLLDTKISEAPYRNRMMSNSNWTELTIICGIPRLELSLYDYTERIKRYGFSHTRILSMCCEALQMKYMSLGRSAISETEGKLLITAQLFFCAEKLVNKPHSEPFDWDVSVMQNRFGLQSTIQLLTKQGYFGKRLAEQLRMASEAFEIEDYQKSMRYLIAFSRIYASLDTSLWGCLFAQKLTALFSEGTNVYSDIYYESAPQQTVFKALNEHLGDTLSQLGFTGELPHFTRRFGRSIHYLSFVMNRNPVLNELGQLQLPYSLSIARVRLGAMESMALGEPEAFSAFCAEDFSNIRSIAKLARIATPEDGGQIEFKIDFLNSGTLTSQSETLLPILEYYVLVADNALKNKPLDKAYLNSRRQLFRRRHILLRTTLPILFCSLASAAALGVWTVDNVFHVNYTKLSIFGLAAAAVIVAFSCAAILFWKRLRSIWLT